MLIDKPTELLINSNFTSNLYYQTKNNLYREEYIRNEFPITINNFNNIQRIFIFSNSTIFSIIEFKNGKNALPEESLLHLLKMSKSPYVECPLWINKIIKLPIITAKIKKQINSYKIKNEIPVEAIKLLRQMLNGGILGE